jgi:disulfide bond formation protein DsbB
MTKTTLRALLAAIGCFCIALLAYAYYLQYGPELQQPCPLCVLQRYTYFVIAVLALAVAVAPRAALIWVDTAVATAGAGLALWQVLKGSSMESCQRDPIGIFVNGLPMADWWPQYLFATGGCADKYSTLGVPVPVWSLVCFIALACALGFIATRLSQSAR